jgi:hypothetical protein
MYLALGDFARHFIIHHSSFNLIASPWLWGAYRLATNTLWGGFDVALMSHCGGFRRLCPPILHSSFILLPSPSRGAAA